MIHILALLGWVSCKLMPGNNRVRSCTYLTSHPRKTHTTATVHGLYEGSRKQILTMNSSIYTPECPVLALIFFFYCVRVMCFLHLSSSSLPFFLHDHAFICPLFHFSFLGPCLPVFFITICLGCSPLSHLVFEHCTVFHSSSSSYLVSHVICGLFYFNAYAYMLRRSAPPITYTRTCNFYLAYRGKKDARPFKHKNMILISTFFTWTDCLQRPHLPHAAYFSLNPVSALTQHT